jgi:hypothetical protein
MLDDWPHLRMLRQRHEAGTRFRNDVVSGLGGNQVRLDYPTGKSH